MRNTIILILLLQAVYAFCQNPQMEWVKSFGGSDFDYPAKIVEMDDGNYLIAGGTRSKDFDITENKGNYDIWLIKLGKNGNILWQKTYGGSQDDAPLGLCKTLDGNYVVAGSTRSKDGDVLENKGLDDVFVWKFDPNGNILWKKYFGGSLNDNLENLSQAANGDLLLSVSSQSKDLDFPDNYGGYDFWILRLTQYGSLKWKIHYGGAEYDYINNTIEVDDKNTLSFGITGSIDYDFKDIRTDFIIKLDSSGNELWKITQNALSKPFTLGGLWSVVYNKNESYLGVGNALSINQSTGYHRDVLVSKFNLKGEILWHKTLGGEGTDFAQDIIKTSDNNYFVIGTEGSNSGDVNCRRGMSDAWLIKIDSSGNILWQTCLGGTQNDSNQAGGIIITKDNSLLTLAIHASNDGVFSKMNGVFDIGVFKFNLLTSTLNNVVKQNITIFPNPSLGFFKVSCPTNLLPIQMNIYNMQGVYISSKYIKSDSEEIDISELKNGVYITSFIKDSKIQGNIKVVITSN
jgi:Secretion system C-terminal sorting domain